MAKITFGIDIGGTNIECGLVSDERIIWRSTRKTEAHLGNEHVMAIVAELVKLGLENTGITSDQIAGVGVGMPGLVDAERGISVLSSNLHFQDYPVADRLTALSGLPVCIENDVKMYVYGEATHGAGQGFGHVLGLTVGTGLASALVMHGNLYSGAGFAGEIGHIPLDGVTQPCNCGLVGCMETIVSATGMARQATQALEQGQISILASKRGHLRGHLTARDVSDAYDQQDPLAVSIMNYTGRTLGIVLSYLYPMLHPDIIIVGGGAAKAGERLLAPAREALRERLLPIYHDTLRLVKAERDEDAGILGSAAWASKQFS